MSRKEALPQIAMNLRWILWHRDTDPERWPDALSKMTRNFVKAERAVGLLLGADPTQDELAVLAEVSRREPEELLSVPLYGSGDTVRKENLRYLLNALPKGEAKEAANRIGITASQLSRWKSNVENPHPANLRKLLKFHGIDPDTDLATEPLFLSMEPISGYKKKEWVLERIKEMPASEISKIYPALKRMLSYDEKD